MHSLRHHHRYSLSLMLTLLATTLTTSEAYAAKGSSGKPKPKPGATGHSPERRLLLTQNSKKSSLTSTCVWSCRLRPVSS